MSRKNRLDVLLRRMQTVITLRRRGGVSSGHLVADMRRLEGKVVA